MKLSESVFYIGVDDCDIDLFESQYRVPEGVSYNSYVILDQKVAIMDTVDVRKVSEWQTNLKAALGDRTPDYLVVHHMEPDHSALIAWVLEQWPSVVVVASAKAIQMFSQFFPAADFTDRTMAVKEGDTLSLGQHCLNFVSAPMIHWPEVMMSFDNFDGALYSADAFGKFGALGSDGLKCSDIGVWIPEAARYYFNIVGKYGGPVQTLLAKAGGLQIKALRPLHGPMIEDNVTEYLALYDRWSRCIPEIDGVFIACASIYGGTMEAAGRLAETLEGQGVKVLVSDLCRSDMAQNVSNAFLYSKIVLASSSYDGGLYPPMFDFIHRLQVKCLSGRRVGVIENGSWAPCAGRMIKDMLASMKDIDVIEPSVTIRSRINSKDFDAIDNLAKSLK